MTEEDYGELWNVFFLELIYVNYLLSGLEDLNSGTDTDDEDNPKKKVPKWAEGTALRTALLKQCYMGPDVDKIFFTIQDPDLSVLFGQQHKRWVFLAINYYHSDDVYFFLFQLQQENEQCLLGYRSRLLQLQQAMLK